MITALVLYGVGVCLGMATGLRFGYYFGAESQWLDVGVFRHLAELDDDEDRLTP